MSDDPTSRPIVAGFRSGVILGWRAWRFEHGQLLSLNHGWPWPFRERAVAHRPPDREGEGDTAAAGFYAYRNASSVVEQHSGRSSGLVWGEVKLWGQVVEHEHGYRAEYAYPSLVVVTSAPQAQLVHRNYGCEVLMDDEMPLNRPNQQLEPQPPIQHTIMSSDLMDFRAHPLNLLAGGRPHVYIGATTAHGQGFQYNGVADRQAIGRWAAAVLETAINEAGSSSYQLMWQVQPPRWQ